MTEKVKRIVEELLKEDYRCRTDDTCLIICVLRKLGFKFWIDYRDMDKIPAFETITRSKRTIMHQENKYNEDFLPEQGVSFEKPIHHKS